MWYDAYKDEKILIHQRGEHNKFWAAWWDEKTNQVHVRWGRLGTKGQSQIKDFGGQHAAIRFIEDKYYEKKKKGYSDKYQSKEITQSTLDRLNAEAAIVGTQNKCHDFQWVELVQEAGNAIFFTKITEERLYDPSCNPGILVHFETRKEIDGQTNFTFLFTLADAYNLTMPSSQRATATQKVTKGPLRKIVDKVEEAIGRSLAVT